MPLPDLIPRTLGEAAWRGLAIRIVLILWSEYHDRNLVPRYTDIDYIVVTDAAKYVTLGESPYNRSTYRYTPLLSYLTIPTTLGTWFMWTGKLLFACCDILLSYLLFRMHDQRLDVLRRPIHNPFPLDKRKSAVAVASLCLFNPIVFNISTRGNSDILVVLAVVATVYLLMQQRTLLAALAHGFAMHLKLYPLIFTPAMALFISGRGASQSNSEGNTLWGCVGLIWRCFADIEVWKFVIPSFLLFFALAAIFEYWYGFIFIYETYLYHFIRADNRHNLSLYFYDIYLSIAGESQPSLLLAMLNFIPQMALILAASFQFWPDLPFCIFVLSWVFVIFNKVCTVQYFLWWLCFLPLILPFCNFKKVGHWGALAVVSWVVSIAAWFYFAFQLEFLGANTFTEIWFMGLCFFGANLFCLGVITRSYRA